MKHLRIVSRHVLASCFVLFVAVCITFAPAAQAQESAEVTQLREQANNMAALIEATTQAYQQAIADVEQLEAQIAENEARSQEIEAKLPEQRTRTAASIKSLYIFQQSSPNLLSLILSSENFNDFITTLRYMDAIQDHNTSEILALASMQDELMRTQANLTMERETRLAKQEEAGIALENARAARIELQEKADALAAKEAEERAAAIAAAQAAIAQAEAQKQAEAQAKLAEQQAAQEKAAQEKAAQEQAAQEQAAQEAAKAEATFSTASGNKAVVEVPEENATSVSTEPLTTNTTATETDGWAARIDAYLAGSPLAGYGSTFAAAAAKYGVDPRFSPAISTIESSQGAICFLPHNAWGWGSSSWSDWESAINDHVAGLASGYDGTLTIEGAMRYCPGTYQEWYSSVLAEMNSI